MIHSSTTRHAREKKRKKKKQSRTVGGPILGAVDWRVCGIIVTLLTQTTTKETETLRDNSTAASA